jgi:hypothetical protein
MEWLQAPQPLSEVTPSAQGQAGILCQRVLITPPVGAQGVNPDQMEEGTRARDP